MGSGKHTLFLFVLIIAISFSVCHAFGDARSEEYRLIDEYTCLPVRGVIELPGVKYDDLTPLAREIFDDNPASVSNALYSLPLDKREEFIVLYLEPFAREKHRAFFERCREAAVRKGFQGVLDGGEIIPAAIRRELVDREKRRLTLHAGALPFQVGSKTVYVPAPEGYIFEETLPANFVREAGDAKIMAVFRKMDSQEGKTDAPARRPVWAMVNHVRETADSAEAMVRAYRTMVDSDWRATAVFPPDGFADKIEAVEYKWNLRPFNIGESGFGYGQFTKTVNKTDGMNQITYKATAIALLPGCYIQVGIVHETDTTLDNVNEINKDVMNWQNAILAANWE